MPAGQRTRVASTAASRAACAGGQGKRDQRWGRGRARPGATDAASMAWCGRGSGRGGGSGD
uniref:Predicted protein n=1 Tax=Hordeum vulgare subsp. vulgare TaxID=112509 RepID=F2E5F0_HORVV|nr:predicted protein [Hordeum vulgare subsp. vulgare]